jgi:hypothetical protein
MEHLVVPSTFAYPEMLHVKSREMFAENMMYKATVSVLLPEGGNKVYGKIAALIHKNGL